MALISQYPAIEKLNEDCLSQIFEYSSITDRLNIEKVCKMWQRVATTVWKTFHNFDITDEDLRISKGCFHCKVNLPICEEIFTRFSRQLTEINLSGTLRDLNETLMDSKFSIRFVKGKYFTIISDRLKDLLLNCTNIEILILGSDVIDIDKLFLSKLLNKNKKIRFLQLEGYDFNNGHLFMLNQDSLESLWISDGTIDLQFLNPKKLSISSKMRRLCLSGDVWSRKDLRKPRSLLPVDLEQLRIGLPDEIMSYFRIISDLPKLKNLKILKINGCDEVTDDVLKAVALKCTKLMAIDIGSCENVTDSGIQNLSHLQKSICLDMSCRSRSRYTDRALEYLGKQLKVVEAKGNNFTNAGASALLQKLENLEILDLDENEQITDDFVISAIEMLKSRQNGITLKLGLCDTAVGVDKVFESCPLLELHIKYPIHSQIHYSKFIPL